ncbi:hypothetical protein JZ751_013819 [Albula glossodonta]|uniref:MAU2 chromatid cohesion factor homolog n=1 Tax=Albula glossodonta TaxID=121402 RepID=A0A8T2NTV5_9TELE|nr:hypothetical protein JZ751_013819 [Albula glossodonta]
MKIYICKSNFLDRECHISQFEDVKFEAASLLSELYCQQNLVDSAKPLLRKAIQISQQTPYWHCRLLFQLAQLHTLEKDLVSACDLLGVGAEYARVVGSEYTRALFLLSKGMLLLMERKLQEVHPLLTLCGQIVENWQGNPIQKESLRVFFLVLQVTHYLDAGQVKSVKPCLKQLQQCIQTISTLHDDEILPSNPADLFHWLPKEHMCVLVYLVTVMHSMQAGYLEKAQKYTDKALMQLEKLKMLDCSAILSSFQVILLEHIIMCRLVTGHKATALQEGLYCISVNCMDNAEAQFTTALRLTTHQELWTFIVTNLASVYIREGNRHQELYSLLERINPDHNFPVRTTSQPAASQSTTSSVGRMALPLFSSRLRMAPPPAWPAYCEPSRGGGEETVPSTGTNTVTPKGLNAGGPAARPLTCPLSSTHSFSTHSPALKFHPLVRPYCSSTHPPKYSSGQRLHPHYIHSDRLNDCNVIHQSARIPVAEPLAPPRHPRHST